MMFLQAAENHDLVDAVHELGREFSFRRFERRAVDLCIDLVVVSCLGPSCVGAKPMPPEIISDISRAPRFEVMMTTVFEKSTRRLSPSVSVALSRIPSSSCHKRIRSLFDLVEQNKVSFVSSVWAFIEIFLRQHRRSFAMAEISRRRTDQLRDLVRMLEFGAVDLHDRVRFAKQNLGRRLDHARLSRAGRPEEQHRADRPRRVVHARQIDLEKPAHPPDRPLLADDQARELVFKFLRPRTLAFGVEQDALFTVSFFLAVSCFIFSPRSNVRLPARLYSIERLFNLDLPVATSANHMQR